MFLNDIMFLCIQFEACKYFITLIYVTTILRKTELFFIYFSITVRVINIVYYLCLFVDNLNLQYTFYFDALILDIYCSVIRNKNTLKKTRKINVDHNENELH